MKKGKRVKPKFPIEYRVLMLQQLDDREKEIVTMVAIRTTIEFKNFLYEIIVEPIVSDRTLHLKIHGLRAPQVTIPGTGPAKFSTTFSKLSGNYNLIIAKPNGEENTFGVAISKDFVTVEPNLNKKFVDVVTKEEEW